MATHARAIEAEPTHEGGWPRDVTRDVAYLRTAIVNVVFFGAERARDWVLIDAGIPGSAWTILSAADRRYGPGARPSAIILTHGHFDHVGALHTLATRWDVPVYAHPLELAYLTGRSPYPPPDPSVGGGLMAAVSWAYPRGPIDLSGRVRPLPEDGLVPGMPGWRWVATPGHTPGHVSLFRDGDRTLIAGDAFVTVKQESALAVMSQAPEIHGPPAYYTQDWPAARHSVRVLDGLAPERAVTGHGVPLGGRQLREGLHALAEHFDELAIPPRGRYVGSPARADARGTVSVPPDPTSPWPRVIGGFAIGAVVGTILSSPRLRSRG
ncbi:putative metallo-hydrolase YflN [Aquisphaera giovannonii]|uniref:Putative metallo-hydrolase YflN n=1 Tax=Aquisphaera giovannonii TaxID=406548 RepID=A0A5B9W3X0_9BACT|nr:MBL fold metallo-hydrolase [Aquisphaera giovannonii]QEH34785.1 putative metallo-hydrolase YflN [Aquisphaera giovannonii]